MLVDLIISRAALRTERVDVHRTATLYCRLNTFLKKVFG